VKVDSCRVCHADLHYREGGINDEPRSCSATRRPAPWRRSASESRMWLPAISPRTHAAAAQTICNTVHGEKEHQVAASGRDTNALAPVTSTTRREVVIDAIRRALLAGELRPGQRVKEAPLAEALGVSRPTVREAIYQLVHEGSLVQVPYKGMTVAQPTLQDLLDVAEVRVSLETLAALHLAQHPDGTGMARLRQALTTHLEAIDAGDVVASDMTHLELHRTLWEGSENQMLIRIWPLVESQIRMAMSLDQATRHDPARDAALHRRLVEVIESGDEEQIVVEVRIHIAGSADEVVRLLQSGEPA
jgi:DNA-binding GntR family transcriptional regulator